ncbi:MULTISPECIES: 1,4-alpha-glucan branching protein GlgB [unclassified Microbacterium]|uniref:1,4-alpha-glucan branching protein GlgB n=1 Tax=unclassified Microbacterium TaxID=2609290 RepID=UPI0012FCE85F|nr:1,4-alpha-glucan branching protein GlgB [Microbacterium sp. MAH-37]MVQ42373.1 1,4-alpha-glucan branching protein GlgB [Microbacterium sp. MAH-37]
MSYVEDVSVSAAWESIAHGAHHDPHSVLGSHPSTDAVGRTTTVIRVRRPLAESVSAVFADGSRLELGHVVHGIWEGSHDGPPVAYRIATVYEGRDEDLSGDPYRHPPALGEVDLHLIGEGRHERLWEALGAHPRILDGETGVDFAVWAPNAQAVRVTGDFNGWNGEGHAMRSMGSSGVWELFIPDVAVGATYKFQLLTPDGRWIFKADPMAQAAEVPPATASVVTLDAYTWADGAWMTRRAATHAVAQPMSVYEVHLGSWRGGMSYRDVAQPLIEHVTTTGFTHVELMPVAEHPFGGSWGYQVTGYYAPTSRYGTPDDLRYLIDQLHQAGIGVILDWVPGHFPKDDFALARFDGRPLYEHPDPRRGEHQDWGTLIFDYGRNEVRGFLVANALYWLSEFHIDGLRVDAVASMLYLDYSRRDGEWEPNVHGGRENLEAIRFLQEVNATAYRSFPGIVMIAEESTAFPGVTAPTTAAGLGFGFKWNMGWMNDSLEYMKRDPIHRSHHEGEMTFSFVYAFGENYVLPISHDEVVHGKGTLVSRMPGDHAHKLANVRAYLAYMWGHPGKKLLFMGQEFGQIGEWSPDRELDWWLLDQPAHQQLQGFVGELNRTYRAQAPLWERDNEGSSFTRLGAPSWDPSVIAFERRDAHGGRLVVISNFAGVQRTGYRLDLPLKGVWLEVLNTDAAEFGGSGGGNLGLVTAHPVGEDAVPVATITLPALSTIWLRYQADPHVPAATFS